MPAVDVFAGIGALTAALGIAVFIYAIRRLRRLARSAPEQSALQDPAPAPPPPLPPARSG